MLTVIDAVEIAPNVFEVRTEIQQVCAACGYDLDAQELKAAQCADCGAPMEIAQNIAVHATSIPMVGATA